MRYSYWVSIFCCCSRNCDATSRKAPFRLTYNRYRFGYATLTILSPPYDTTKSTHSTTTSTKKTLTYREVEENGKLPFLDCLVSRDDNSLRTTVYRKPTHIDRLLDESSYSPTSHKATTIRTLTRQTAYPTRTSTLTVFFLRTTTTKTSSNVTLTDLLLLPKLTPTQLLRLQQLYRT